MSFLYFLYVIIGAYIYNFMYMKKLLLASGLLFALSSVSVFGSFMYEETEPCCSLTGQTHTSFPWEISDTSTWKIPTVYEAKCDTAVPELTQAEKDRVYKVMKNLFKEKSFMWPVYGGSDGYGWDATLNPKGQKFVNEVLFPAMIQYIQTERKKSSPEYTHIALLNYAAKVVGYDYRIFQPE